MFLSDNKIYFPKFDGLDVSKRSYFDDVQSCIHGILEQEGMISEKAFSEQDRIIAESKEIAKKRKTLIDECERNGKRVELCAEMIWDKEVHSERDVDFRKEKEV